MKKYLFSCKKGGLECDYKAESKNRAEVESEGSAHAQRFHAMNDSQSIQDLVSRSLEEVEDYRD
jgi:predicted small metal-binding protein